VKICFTDIDGVLNNRSCYFPGNQHPKYGRNPDPKCVAALNWLCEKTGAQIVVSSTWRIGGLDLMRETINSHWGVNGPVIDVTPRLLDYRGDITLSVPRGREIQAWLDRRKQDYAHCGGHWGDVDRFVILDDDSDMEHLLPHLVKTDFEHGLTMEKAADAAKVLDGFKTCGGRGLVWPEKRAV